MPIKLDSETSTWVKRYEDISEDEKDFWIELVKDADDLSCKLDDELIRLSAPGTKEAPAEIDPPRQVRPVPFEMFRNMSIPMATFLVLLIGILMASFGAFGLNTADASTLTNCEDYWGFDRVRCDPLQSPQWNRQNRFWHHSKLYAVSYIRTTPLETQVRCPGSGETIFELLAKDNRDPMDESESANYVYKMQNVNGNRGLARCAETRQTIFELIGEYMAE